LREAVTQMAVREGWNIFLPARKFTTDNAAMIAVAGYFKYLNGEFASQDLIPYARGKF
jgi:N6-L-threonylcarbamoyladenine synthase